jgi:hypothetical protein
VGARIGLQRELTTLVNATISVSWILVLYIVIVGVPLPQILRLIRVEIETLHYCLMIPIPMAEQGKDLGLI